MKINKLLIPLVLMGMLTGCGDNQESNESSIIEPGDSSSESSSEESSSSEKEFDPSFGVELIGSPLVKTSDEIIGEAFEKFIGDNAMYKMVVTALINGVINSTIGESSVTFKRYTLNYDSTYYDGSDVRLSGALTIPYLNDEPLVKGIAVDNHPTLDSLEGAPSNGFDICCVATFAGCAVIEADLVGFGVSSNLPQDYHCRHLVERNTVDFILACEYFMENELDIDLTDKPMFNEGYSQGGYDTMAVTRYMEIDATEYEKEHINFNKTMCGSGAYDPLLMFTESLKNESFDRTELLLIALISAFEFHPDLLNGYQYSDFLTEYGMRFIEPINNKNSLAVSELKESAPSGISLNRAIFKEDMFNTESDLFKAAKKGFEEENLIDGNWLPQGDLWLYYSTTDELVSPKCSIKALEVFEGLDNVTNSTVTGAHADSALSFYTSVIDFIRNTYDA